MTRQLPQTTEAVDAAALVANPATILLRASTVLRWSVAFVWFATAIVSAFIFPEADSLGLLARARVPDTLQPAALYGAAAIDLLFGVLSITARRPWWLWRAQIALILGYMAIITLRLPEFWWHPYGPLTKNVPMLGVLWVLDGLERVSPLRADGR